MEHNDLITSRNLDTPARYLIKVYGHLDSSWSPNLGSMDITRSYSCLNQPVSTLTGTLIDQAALSGVLNTLHDLHIRLISVETLDESQEGDDL